MHPMTCRWEIPKDGAAVKDMIGSVLRAIGLAQVSKFYYCDNTDVLLY